MKVLIAGLGNIGDDYINTRHNIGFLIADYFAQKHRLTFERGRHADVVSCKIKNKFIWLIKPTTYMNLSGKAVLYWMRKLEITPAEVLVCMDDISLPLGKIRIRPRGSDGGHNGLADIIYQLQTDEFPRMRFGIGGDFAKGQQVNYVLGQMDDKEMETVQSKLGLTEEAIVTFAMEGLGRTMTKYNNA